MIIVIGTVRMFSMNDVKFVAEAEYEINNNNYSREYLIEMIVDITDTFHLIENIKKKEKELSVLIED